MRHRLSFTGVIVSSAGAIVLNKNGLIDDVFFLKKKERR